MKDQAERLRQMVERLQAAFPAVAATSPPAPKPVPPAAVPEPARPAPAARPAGKRARVLAVTSGKGGVGKTNLSINLAYSLLKMGREVVLLDADLGLANVDVLLGTTPRYHLGHLLTGERTIKDLIYMAPEGLRLIAGGSGFAELSDVDVNGLRRFVQSMRELQDQTDFLVVDTSAGIGQSVMAFTLAADEVVVVTTPEPTALTDAYALMKTILRQQSNVRLRLVVNQAHDQKEAQEAAHRLSTTVLRFLNAPLENLGAIPHDPQVGRAVRGQSPFLLAHPNCPASRAVQRIAERIAGEPRTTQGQFLDRLVRFLTQSRKAT